MIGIIGPADSIQIVSDVAEELGCARALVLRPYRTPNEAPRMALGLQSVCQVLLFTGRVPYVLASGAGGYTVPMEYIPHSGLDLYRALATLLLLPEHKDKFPRISVDSIPAAEVREVFDDLNLEPPEHVLSIELSPAGAAFNLNETVATHVRLFQEGSVDICLTSIGWIHHRLRAQKVQCLRIDHSRLVVREALQRAQLLVRLGRAEESQVAVCMIGGRDPDAPGDFADAIARRLVSMLGGSLARARSGAGMIMTTRGAVGRFLRFELGSRSSPMRTEIRARVSIGFGFGATPAEAEENADRALKVARREGVLTAAYEDGVARFDTDGTSPSGYPPTAAAAKVAARLELSLVLVQRLENLLRSLDSQRFSAAEFAEAMGIRPRSARRTIARLLKKGVIAANGYDVGPGAGRPKAIYRFQRDFLDTFATI